MATKAIKNAVGRPTKINMRTVFKLADAIAHSASITDSCRYAGISRQVYYYHFNSNPVFAERMTLAKENQRKAVFNFLTS